LRKKEREKKPRLAIQLEKIREGGVRKVWGGKRGRGGGGEKSTRIP